jgi:tellurium resistance protein TerD
MTMQLAKGQNTTLTSVADAGGLVVGARWTGSLDCDLVAIVCSDKGQVLSDDDFLFWGNRAAPSRAAFLRQRQANEVGRDRGQVLVALSALPQESTRIVVALATVVDGATLSEISGLALRCWDSASGRELLRFEIPDERRPESCLVLGETYRRGDSWKFRAIGQGYATGLRGLGTDYGVNID